MTTLPASCRLSLWATAALAGAVPLARVGRLSAPDYDEVDGVDAWLTLRRDLGERVVLCALPRPGDTTGLPRGSGDLVHAAVGAGECVWVPVLGGALVPADETYGSPGDEGSMLRWTAHDSEPAPTHRIEALHTGDVELALRQELLAVTTELEALGAVPLGSAALRASAEAGLGGALGVPDGLPDRVVRVLGLASALDRMTRVATADAVTAVGSSTEAARRATLERLRRAADRALADATNLGALHLAGLR